MSAATASRITRFAAPPRIDNRRLLQAVPVSRPQPFGEEDPAVTTS
ncbi:hypothetical protein [Roseomonas chloroacetimidivorans]|jgi:hypothetical protein